MKNYLFGTDGIRTSMGQSPLTVEKLPYLGYAIARWAQESYGINPVILIATDTRISCSLVKSALSTGLLMCPVKLADAGVLPSPAVGQLLHYNTNFDLGIIISASHNQYQDNGIKLVVGRTGKLSAQDEQRISELFATTHVLNNYDHLGTSYSWQQANDEYCANIARFFQPFFLREKKIVLDCAHGATSILAPKILADYGARVISINNQPNGININKQCGSLHPQALQKAVVDHKADVGFAFDGDGDRVIVVNKHGQVYNGDDILALLLEHPTYSASQVVVGTSMTNQGFECFLAERNKQLIRTAVGDRYVAQALVEYDALLGGEASGHIIARDYLPTGDGIFVALRLLQTLIAKNNTEMITFTKMPQIILNVPVHEKKNLDDTPFAQIISESKEQLDKGRIIVRYSGTENVLRIMIEDTNFEHAQAIISELAKSLQQQLNRS